MLGRTKEDATGDPVKLKARWNFNRISSDLDNVALTITCDGGSPSCLRSVCIWLFEC